MYVEIWWRTHSLNPNRIHSAENSVTSIDCIYVVFIYMAKTHAGQSYHLSPIRVNETDLGSNYSNNNNHHVAFLIFLFWQIVYFPCVTVIFYWCLILPELSTEFTSCWRCCLLLFVWNQFGISCIKAEQVFKGNVLSLGALVPVAELIFIDSPLTLQAACYTQQHSSEMPLFGMWEPDNEVSDTAFLHDEKLQIQSGKVLSSFQYFKISIYIKSVKTAEWIAPSSLPRTAQSSAASLLAWYNEENV